MLAGVLELDDAVVAVDGGGLGDEQLMADISHRPSTLRCAAHLVGTRFFDDDRPFRVDPLPIPWVERVPKSEKSNDQDYHCFHLSLLKNDVSLW